MSEKKQWVLIGLGIVFVIGLGMLMGRDIKLSHEERDANPFTPLGQIKTPQGLELQFYSLKHTKADCVVMIQMFNEPGRAAGQMECKH